MKPERRKSKKISHNDTVSVELAADEYTED
jgi:hypothetical protein